MKNKFHSKLGTYILIILMVIKKIVIRIRRTCPLKEEITLTDTYSQPFNADIWWAENWAISHHAPLPH